MWQENGEIVATVEFFVRISGITLNLNNYFRAVLQRVGHVGAVLASVKKDFGGLQPV